MEVVELQQQRPNEAPGLKPARPGLLRDSLLPQEHTEKPQFGNLIVFGQGPVIGRESRVKPDIGEVEDINMWGKTVARAAGELKLAGVVDKIIFTGGKTGGEQFKSEAELMRDVLTEEYPEILPEDIILEPAATNTLENFAYTINRLDKEAAEGKQINGKTAFLGADYHIARIKQLARMYGYDNPQGFSAEAIFKVIAERTQDQVLYDQIDKVLAVNDDLSIPDARLAFEQFAHMSSEEKRREPSRSAMHAPTFFEQLEGTEKKGVLQRVKEEQRWGRGLSEIPEYWVGYLGYLDGDARLQAALDNVDTADLQKMGIDRSRPLDEVRDRLLEYTKPEKRKIPPSEWENS